MYFETRLRVLKPEEGEEMGDNKKILYWIDDNIQQMFYIVQEAILKLWRLEREDGISSKIIIFGNNCENGDSDELYSKEKEDEYWRELWIIYKEICQSYEGPNPKHPIFNKKKDLVEDAICFLFKKDNPGDLKAYGKIKTAWTRDALVDSSAGNYEKAKKEAAALLTRINIQENSVVGIDLSLLNGDVDRVKAGKRIISMELFHQLTEAGTKCFLYSTDADDEEFRGNWEKSYKKLYKDDSTAITIYNRNDFMQKGSDTIVDTVEKMFSTNE